MAEQNIKAGDSSWIWSNSNEATMTFKKANENKTITFKKISANQSSQATEINNANTTLNYLTAIAGISTVIDENARYDTTKKGYLQPQ